MMLAHKMALRVALLGNKSFEAPALATSHSIAEQSIMTTKRKTILITGSTDGVGRYVAERLAAQDWRVMVHGRDRARGEAVVARISKQGGEARFLAADLSLLAEFALLPRRWGAMATVSTRSSTTPGSAQAARDANSAPTASNCASRSIISLASCWRVCCSPCWPAANPLASSTSPRLANSQSTFPT